MQIVYWPENLCKFLKERYHYNGETGWVTYRDTATKRQGPMTQGPLGTKNPSGTIINVKFQQRQWVLNMGRLCVFLQTGKQYRKVGFLDGNRSNYKLDNLVGMQELTEEPDATKEMAQMVLEESRKREEKVKAQQHRLVDLAVTQEPKKELVTDTVKTINIGYKTGEELWAEIAAEELEFKKAYQVTPYGRAETLLAIRLEREHHRLIAEAGLYTGGKWFELQDHYDRWSPVLAFNLADYVIGQTVEVAESEPKWKHDFYYACRLLKNVEKGIITRDQVDTLLSKYTWQGQEYRRPDFLPQLGADYVSAVTLLELEHRTTREGELEFLHYCARHGLEWRVTAVANETI